MLGPLARKIALLNVYLPHVHVELARFHPSYESGFLWFLLQVVEIPFSLISDGSE